MNFVEPIRDRKKIAQIKNLLLGQKRFRDLLLFVVGINTALRISDLLQLQTNHFLDEQGRIRYRFWIKERKRGKRHEVVINASIRETFGEYLVAFPDIRDDRKNFLFFNSKAKITLTPSNAAKPGNLSLRSVKMQAYPATLAHIVCERLGVIMLVCKVWTWRLSCTSSIMKASPTQSATWVSLMMDCRRWRSV